MAYIMPPHLVDKYAPPGGKTPTKPPGRCSCADALVDKLPRPHSGYLWAWHPEGFWQQVPIETTANEETGTKAYSIRDKKAARRHPDGLCCPPKDYEWVLLPNTVWALRPVEPNLRPDEMKNARSFDLDGKEDSQIESDYLFENVAQTSGTWGRAVTARARSIATAFKSIGKKTGSKHTQKESSG